jgi:uncharacterized protein YdbL (DUF1318 family)
VKKKTKTDDECSHITSEKNETYKCMIQRNSATASAVAYKNARRNGKRLQKKKKRQQVNGKIEKLEELGKENKARKSYKEQIMMEEDINQD